MSKREWFRFIIGPWPVYPLYSFIIIALFLNFATSEPFLFDAEPEYGPFQSAIVGMPSAIITSLGFNAVWVVSEYVRKRFVDRPMSSPWYLATLIVSSFVYTEIRMHTMLGNSGQLDAVTTIRDSLRMFVAFLILMNILGFIYTRFQANARRAEEALSVVEEQRRLIIKNEEQTRRSVAQFLHDTVQANLVAISMQLDQLRGNVAKTDSDVIGSIIEAVEAIRRDDVRMASHRLSPDISSTGIVPSLKLLAQAYEPAMHTRFEVSPDAENALQDSTRSALAQLAVYRILEQALLNAAVHGRASDVAVSIRSNGDGVELNVSDNGSGVNENPAPGRGAAVISGWTAMFHGDWSVAPGPSGGTVLRARLSNADS